LVLLVALCLTGCAGPLHVLPPRVPRACPDGAPPKLHQDPACGRACGYSCLPDRWIVVAFQTTPPSHDVPPGATIGAEPMSSLVGMIWACFARFRCT
jgi:hypothetical protein